MKRGSYEDNELILIVRNSSLAYENYLGNPEQNEKLAKVSNC